MVKELASFSEGLQVTEGSLQVTEGSFQKEGWQTGSRPGRYTKWEINHKKRHGLPGMYLVTDVLSASITKGPGCHSLSGADSLLIQLPC